MSVIYRSIHHTQSFRKVSEDARNSFNWKLKVPEELLKCHYWIIQRDFPMPKNQIFPSFSPFNHLKNHFCTEYAPYLAFLQGWIFQIYLCGYFLHLSSHSFNVHQIFYYTCASNCCITGFCGLFDPFTNRICAYILMLPRFQHFHHVQHVHALSLFCRNLFTWPNFQRARLF